MTKLALDALVTYTIEVQGYLDEQWLDWFGSTDILPHVHADGTSTTRLTCTVVDQSALHGLLRKLHDLGLPLLSVHRVEPGQADAADRQPLAGDGDGPSSSSRKGRGIHE